MIFPVYLQRSVSEEATIDVEAGDAREAEEVARVRAGDGLVAWVEVHNETTAEAKDS